VIFDPKGLITRPDACVLVSKFYGLNYVCSDLYGSVVEVNTHQNQFDSFV
jgi:hypothetical protein